MGEGVRVSSRESGHIGQGGVLGMGRPDWWPGWPAGPRSTLGKGGFLFSFLVFLFIVPVFILVLLYF